MNYWSNRRQSIINLAKGVIIYYGWGALFGEPDHGLLVDHHIRYPLPTNNAPPQGSTNNVSPLAGVRV